jgi:hypothetical protein
MSQTTVQTTVPTSTRAARPTAGKTSPRKSVEKKDSKKVRKNGLVASTILLDTQTDEFLTDLAYLLRKNRSELACDWIKDRLARFDIAEKFREKAQKYKAPDADESDDDENRQGEGNDSSQEKGEAA